MIERNLKEEVVELLEDNPAVALMGPRQVGKTTLALSLTENRDSVYLDLEDPLDIAKMEDFERFCEFNEDKLIILDEVQRLPEIFAPIRSIIDRRKRKGLVSGQFLFLGSASIELLKQSSETLAGRISYCELFPLSTEEAASNNLETAKLWLRGGFPDSFLAKNDTKSFRWRNDFIRTYLERDIPALGPRIPAETLRRFWTMLAHNQGAQFNASSHARNLDLASVTVGRYLDLLTDLLLVRKISPWLTNVGKRLVKAPKVYIRDSGITHALLGIETHNELLGHPVLGASWEGFVLENLLGVLPTSAQYGYYRTVGGAEIDLVIQKGNELWTIEIKSSSAPKVSKGYHIACEDLKPTRKFVVYSGTDHFPLKHGIEAISITGLMGLLRDL